MKQTVKAHVKMRNGKPVNSPEYTRVITKKKKSTYDMKNISIRMPSELRDKLRENAKDEGLAMWAYLERIDAYYQEHGASLPAPVAHGCHKCRKDQCVCEVD